MFILSQFGIYLAKRTESINHQNIFWNFKSKHSPVKFFSVKALLSSGYVFEIV